MAEISKYKATMTGKLFQHNNRIKNDGVQHSNKDIDNDRTDENYAFKKLGQGGLKKRLSEVYHLKRSNLCVLVEVIVTLPQDVAKEDEEKFFEGVYRFYCGDFGEENIVNAVVHKDETTPHLHLDFVPVIPLIEKQKEGKSLTSFQLANAKKYQNYLTPEQWERQMGAVKIYEAENHVTVDGVLNAKRLLDRDYYRQMHTRLYDYMADVLGYECEILNGATAGGNKTILELKNRKLELEVARKQEMSKNLQKNINTVLKQLEYIGLDKNHFDSTEMINHMYLLTHENLFLKELITEHGLELPSEEIKGVIQLSHALKSNFTYHEQEAFSSCFSGQDGKIVLETYKERPRVLPQRRIIEANHELEEIVENVRPTGVYEFGNYVFFPTDNIEDTLHNLLYLKKHEHQFKKLNFPQISNDIYGIAEQILKNCMFETEYYLKDLKDRDTFLRERNITKLVEN